jgi:hypothetical protein
VMFQETAAFFRVNNGDMWVQRYMPPLWTVCPMLSDHSTIYVCAAVCWLISGATYQ